MGRFIGEPIGGLPRANTRLAVFRKPFPSKENENLVIGDHSNEKNAEIFLSHLLGSLDNCVSFRACPVSSLDFA